MNSEDGLVLEASWEGTGGRTLRMGGPGLDMLECENVTNALGPIVLKIGC